jgi:DNA-binding NarL/FixJ family response regulator
VKLHRLTQSKLDDYKLRSNFTEDEEITFDMLSKGKSINEIATRLSVSTRTVDRRIADIKSKINQL